VVIPKLTQSVQPDLLPHSGLGLASLIFDAFGVLSYFILHWLLFDTGANHPYLLWWLFIGSIVIGGLLGLAGMLQKGRSLLLPFIGLLVNMGFWAYVLLLTPRM
jgi:hypothetical protein